MTYETAMTYMEQVQKKGSVLGLGPITRLLEYLKNPQNNLSVIHIAGTNGKGSICTFLECLYKGEGKRVGRYISPTLHSYLERFQINGIEMSREQFAHIFERVKCALDKMEQQGEPMPTAFEIETAIAFLYFLEEQVDIVILETGMGGREDATNVVAKPLCTVFASIGMDHMQFLGETIEEIAHEKAGIMRKDVLAVSYPNVSVVQDVLKKEYSLHNTDSLRFVDEDDIEILEETLAGSRFSYKGEEYQISLAGRYQIYNAATAILTKLLLDGHVDKSSLLHAKWEGRFEKVSENPLFIKDGAHNIDGVKALKESVEKHFTNYHLIFIIGVLRDKAYDEMMELLCPMAKKVYTITPPGERGLPATDLATCVKHYCENVVAMNSVEEAIEEAKTLALTYESHGNPVAIIAWGSLSYIGQIRE